MQNLLCQACNLTHLTTCYGHKFTLDLAQNKTILNLFTHNNARVHLSQQQLFENSVQQHKFVQSTSYHTIFSFAYNLAYNLLDNKWNMQKWQRYRFHKITLPVFLHAETTVDWKSANTLAISIIL